MFKWQSAAVATVLGCATLAVQAAPVKVLFVGNSYTFGRVDPVMSYHADAVHDLTEAMWLADDTGSNLFEPHPWGGVPAIFKRLTEQAGLDYDVSLSTRNAASLRGHFLNLNPAGWDLRGNIASQRWDQVVLQEQSDEALPKQEGLNSNPDWFVNYVDKIEDFIHVGAADAYSERDFFPGDSDEERSAACQAATGASATTCNRVRDIPANPNANPDAQVYLYQTWARPNLINAPFTTETDPETGEVRFTETPAVSYYPSLESMTADLIAGYRDAARLARKDGTGGVTDIAPVGRAFLRAVRKGRATRDMYADDATTDGLIDLWFDDGTHASKYGSYLSALVMFGTLTGLNPAMFGGGEAAAQELGISRQDARKLQRTASEQLGCRPGRLATCER